MKRKQTNMWTSPASLGKSGPLAHARRRRLCPHSGCWCTPASISLLVRPRRLDRRPVRDPSNSRFACSSHSSSSPRRPYSRPCYVPLPSFWSPLRLSTHTKTLQKHQINHKYTPNNHPLQCSVNGVGTSHMWIFKQWLCGLKFFT